jgi:Zincin-like metallopeptidase
MNYQVLQQLAHEEIQLVMAILSETDKRAYEQCVLVLDTKPSTSDKEHHLKGDELGVFEGNLWKDAQQQQVPTIRLFLENIWQWVEFDEQDFRDEVGATFLNQLGIFLGWSQD